MPRAFLVASRFALFFTPPFGRHLSPPAPTRIAFPGDRGGHCTSRRTASPSPSHSCRVQVPVAAVLAVLNLEIRMTASSALAPDDTHRGARRRTLSAAARPQGPPARTRRIDSCSGRRGCSTLEARETKRAITGPSARRLPRLHCFGRLPAFGSREPSTP